MPVFVATLRAIYDADDEVEAQLIAENIRENGEVDLDSEEEDELFVTQVTANLQDITPEESLVLFKLTRNALIKTRIKECFELAKQLDETIYVLTHRDEKLFDLAQYDRTRIFEIAEQLLLHNQNPLD